MTLLFYWNFAIANKKAMQDIFCKNYRNSQTDIYDCCTYYTIFLHIILGFAV